MKAFSLLLLATAILGCAGLLGEQDIGGSLWDVQLAPEDAGQAEAVAGVLSTRMRAMGTGLGTVEIQERGSLVVWIPAQLPASAYDGLFAANVLGFHQVDEERMADMTEGSELLSGRVGADSPAQLTALAHQKQWLPPDRIISWFAEKPGVKQESWEEGGFILHAGPFLTHQHIQSVSDQESVYDGFPRLLIEFDETGTQILAEKTGENIGKRLAITLDGMVILAPVIREGIDGGQLSIEFGRVSLEEATEQAQMLKASLQSPPLPVAIPSATKRSEHETKPGP